jgi:hypothetical protein
MQQISPKVGEIPIGDFNIQMAKEVAFEDLNIVVGKFYLKAGDAILRPIARDYDSLLNMFIP